MTKQKPLAIGAIVALLAVPAANAQETPAYFGLKAGRMDADAGGFSTASNVGFTLGYVVVEDYNGAFALEAEYTRNLSSGNVSIGGASGDWRIETLAGYGAYRTAGDAYLKGKFGLLRRDVKVGGVAAHPLDGKDNELSFGAGAGVRFNRKIGLEFEYTIVENDIGFVSLGYFTHF